MLQCWHHNHISPIKKITWDKLLDYRGNYSGAYLVLLKKKLTEPSKNRSREIQRVIAALKNTYNSRHIN